MKVAYTPQFRRQFRKLPKALQEEILEKIEAFHDQRKHESLRVHKLHGKMEGRMSFWVNYRYRVVFMFESRTSALLLAVGDHSLYE